MYGIYGLLGEVTISLFVVLVLAMRFRNSRTCGYSIIAPLTLAGAATIGGMIVDFLGPSGIAFAIISLLGLIAAGYVIYRFRARAWSNYTLSILLVMFTAVGVYFEGLLFGAWPCLFLFTSLVLIAFLIAHENILSGPLNLPSIFKMRGGIVLLFFAMFFFVLGVYLFVFPEFGPIANSFFSQSVWVEGTLEPFALFLLPLILLSTVSIIGARWSLPVAYGVFAIFAAFGILGLVQTNITGVWSPTALFGSLVWVVASVLLFYEPSFKFVNNYYPVPFKLSLEFRLKANKAFIVGKVGLYSIVRTLSDPSSVSNLYEGRDVNTNREVILKEPKADPSEHDAVQSLQNAIREMDKESEVLSTVDFPGVVEFIEEFQYSGRQFMVEELIRGRSLGKMWQSKELPFRLSDSINHTLEILYSLNYLHAHGILHRDLSYNNVMMTNQGIVKLIDFGLAKKMIRTSTTGFRQGKTAPRGTEGFCAPEIDDSLKQSGIKLSFSYDIYSTGALMYLMISGEPPPDWFHVGPATIDNALVGKCDAKTIGIIKKAMSKDAPNRYQTAFEMIAAIKGYKGKFIVTDYAEAYDLTGCTQFTLLSDHKHKAVQGETFQEKTRFS